MKQNIIVVQQVSLIVIMEFKLFFSYSSKYGILFYLTDFPAYKFYDS